MKYAQKLFVSTIIYLSIALVSVCQTSAFAKSKGIIYEYETITQKKGESFDKALKRTQLNLKQRALVKAIPIPKVVKSPRAFQFIYAVNRHRHLLREVKVTQAKNTQRYILSKRGRLKFVKGYSKIPSKLLRKRSTKFTTKEQSKKAHKVTKEVPKLMALVLTQKKNQSIEQVLDSAKLTALQRKVILQGNFLKKALSSRTLKIFFEERGGKKLLKGLSIIRGKRQINYTVRFHKNGLKLVPLVRLSAAEQKQIKRQFSTARMTVLKEKSTKSKTQSQKSSSKNTAVKARSSKNYQVLSFTQRKGRSLTSAMRSVKLTRLQRGLINKMPIAKSAKSNRRIHLLLQKQGNKKYLRAIRIVRGKHVAECVLVKYKGQFIWANDKGQITIRGKKGRATGRYPLRYTRISSGFNLRRRHPITRRIRPHKGIDLAAPHGTPIYAPASGVVEFAGRQRGYGIIVTINHRNGYKTKYAHLSRIARGVRRGATVSRGQFIARVGNTGRSTGAHLHYEVLVNGRPRNPAYVRVPNSFFGGGKKTLKLAKQSAAIYLPKLRALSR